MSIAIGSSAVSGAAAHYPSRAGLESEVASYKKQLADCVNCPVTSGSPEGKATIQDLSSKISADQGLIRQIEAAKAAGNDSNVSIAKPADEANVYTAAGAAASPTDTGRGNLVNVFA